MNSFDALMLAAVAHDGVSSFDRVVVHVVDNELLKGGLAMAALWALWFARGPARQREGGRRYALATLGGTFAALVIARALALALPFRERPFHALAGFTAVPLRALEGWSSFPSDHAALFFGLATGLALCSRWLGIVAFAHAVVVIAAPRIYLGLHYPTDIVAGAAIGVGTVLLSTRIPVIARLTARLCRWESAQPAVFYAAAFLLTFEVATLFDSVRGLAKLVLKEGGPGMIVAGVLLLAVPVTAALIALGRRASRPRWQTPELGISGPPR